MSFFRVLSAVFLVTCLGACSPSSQKNVGAQAPDFTLPLLSENSSPVTLSNVTAEQQVLLVFWATWCPSCVAEIPVLNEWNKKYASQGLKILGINIEEPRGKVLEFAEKYPMDYSILLDSDGQTAAVYGLVALPVTVMLATGGKIIYYGFGLPEIEELMDLAPSQNVPWQA
ncbi:MAG: TlpA disulfide reductase family protein [Candidatus Omnitrophota bacterium]|nr:TlpA disulfide reductase family protein [Candidatus Omnitrophota bacterium]